MRINLSSFLRLAIGTQRQLVPIAILFCLCVTSQAQQFSNKLFLVAFDYPTNSPTNVLFRVHSSQDITQPVADWITVLPEWITKSTNSADSTVTIISSNRVLATTPQQFFVVSASNEWGIIFSEVLATSPPREGLRLRLLP